MVGHELFPKQLVQCH